MPNPPEQFGEFTMHHVNMWLFSDGPAHLWGSDALLNSEGHANRLSVDPHPSR